MSRSTSSSNRPASGRRSEGQGSPTPAGFSPVSIRIRSIAGLDQIRRDGEADLSLGVLALAPHGRGRGDPADVQHLTVPPGRGKLSDRQSVYNMGVTDGREREERRPGSACSGPDASCSGSTATRGPRSRPCEELRRGPRGPLPPLSEQGGAVRRSARASSTPSSPGMSKRRLAPTSMRSRGSVPARANGCGWRSTRRSSGS